MTATHIERIAAQQSPRRTPDPKTGQFIVRDAAGDAWIFKETHEADQDRTGRWGQWLAEHVDTGLQLRHGTAFHLLNRINAHAMRELTANALIARLRA